MYKRNKGLLRNPFINVNEVPKLPKCEMAKIKIASLKILKYIERLLCMLSIDTIYVDM